MIVAVFVIFSLFRGLTHKRKSISHKSPRPSLVTEVSTERVSDHNHKNAVNAVEGANLNSSIEDLCVSLCQSESIYSSATSKIYDKRRQDSSSICSDIFNTDEGGRSVSEEVRFTTRKSLTRIRRCTSRTSLSRRRRTTGRYQPLTHTQIHAPTQKKGNLLGMGKSLK